MEGLFFYQLDFPDDRDYLIGVIYRIFKRYDQPVAGGNNIVIIIGSVKYIKNIIPVHSAVVLFQHSQNCRK